MHRFILLPAGIILAVCLVSSPAAARPARSTPSIAQIRAVMARTVEASDHRTSFAPLGRPLTIQDGRGTGTVTAIVGVRHPSADAYGQLVFFWHNTTFAGWDSQYEVVAVQRLVSHAAGSFSITYPRYKPNDPLCCPSRKPVTLQYGWGSGRYFISNGIPPRLPGAVKVVLLH